MTQQELWNYYMGAARILGRGKDKDQAGYSLWQFYRGAPGRNPLTDAFLGGEADREDLAWPPPKDVPEDWYLEGHSLNESQRRAIRVALASPISFIKGPPGTGKTFTILNLASCILHAGGRAAIVSCNNSALSNIVDSIGRFSPDLPNQRRLQERFARLGNKFWRCAFNQEHPNCGFQFSNTAHEPEITAGAFLERFPIFTSTIHSLQKCFRDGNTYQYDYIIMDETSQVDVIAGLVAMNCARRLVLVGDDDQLPPVLNGAMAADLNQALLAQQAQLPQDPYLLRAERSFLGACLAVFRPVSAALEGEAPLRAREVTLNEHYRCHPGIFRFCAENIYNTGDHPEADRLRILTADTTPHMPIRVLWFEGNYCERRFLTQTPGASKWNGKQVTIFMEEEWEDLLARKQREPELSICVLSPFRGQLEALHEAIRRWYTGHPELTPEDIALFAGTDDSSEPPMLTVHKSQGQEFDIVYLLPVEDGDWEWPWSQKKRLINVAVSRARAELRIITSSVLMEETLQRSLTGYYISPSRQPCHTAGESREEEERFLQKLLHYVHTRGDDAGPAGPFGFHRTGLSSVFDPRAREVERRRVIRAAGPAAPDGKPDLSAWELCLWGRLMDILPAQEQRLRLYANVPVRDVLTREDWADMDRRRQALDREDWAALFDNGRRELPASYRELLSAWAWEALDAKARNSRRKTCRKELGGKEWDAMDSREQQALAAQKNWDAMKEQARSDVCAAHWEVLLAKYWDDLRSYAANAAHFDFLLCDEEGRVLLAAEADGEQHRFPWTASGGVREAAALPADRDARRRARERQRRADFAYQQECDWKKDALAKEVLGAAVYLRGNRRPDLAGTGGGCMAFLRLPTDGSTCLEVRALWDQAGQALRNHFFPIEELLERQLARTREGVRIYRPVSASAALRLPGMEKAKAAVARYKARRATPAGAVCKILCRLGYLAYCPGEGTRGTYYPTKRGARCGIVRMGGLDAGRTALFTSPFYSPRAVRLLRSLLVPDRRRSLGGGRWAPDCDGRMRLAVLRRAAVIRGNQTDRGGSSL